MYYAPGTALGITLTNNDVLTASDQNTLDDKLLLSWTRTDGFGRTVEAWSRDPQGDDQVVTIYDALGRASKQSNPLRPSLGESPAYATTNFDLAGRVKSVTTSDTATVTTSYSSNTVTVTDQMGKQRTSVTDGLGRLIAVYEAPNGPNYLTSYSYDTLDNLTGVSQYDSVSNITQTRTFAYDSLKRLWSATNPESGTICYGTLSNGQCQANGYDGNGNLLYKTDARGVLSTYGYDALNRNTSISYSDNSPGVGRVYDSATNGKGRLAYQWVGAGDTSKNSLMVIDAYDALGRVKNWRQQFWGDGNWGAPYAMFSNYDLAGHVTLMHYPTGHEAYYSYDSAGRTNAFTGNLGSGGAGRNYSTGISYSAFGGMSQEQFGTQTAIYNKLFYNSRGQLAEIREGRSANDDSYQLGAIINFYDTCWGQCSGQNMPINNGNLRTQQVYIPRDENPGYQNRTDMFSQGYDYDALNRLLSVEEGSWRQKYHYDRFGNRTIDTNPNETHGGVNNLGFAVEPGTNRLYAPGDLAQVETARQMRYDAAGNLKKDTYTGAGDRTYDAENRMTQAWANNQWQTYVYDADGRRVKRNVGGTDETWQVYGVGGELLAEYAANGTLQKEYGYRNGQLLITATVTSGGGWGAAPPLDDNPLNPPNQPKTDVKAIHITQLRTAINAVRAHYNLGAYQWQKPTASGGAINNSVLISWEPIDEMRTALDQALGPPSPPYTGGLALNQPILAIHIQELRDRVLAVWNSGGSGGPDTRWLVSDQLGTPRIVFDQSGALATVSRHDYLPFGEEIPSGFRSGISGYGANDGTRQKFTQKERDIETGLDYFGARYYGSTQGRFTSVDPVAIKLKHLTNPQDLNRYAYVANNPLAFFDPDGREKITIIIRTFIPQKQVMTPLGPVKGDGRNVGEPGTYRTEFKITVETDMRKNGGNVFVDAKGRAGVSEGPIVTPTYVPGIGPVPMPGYGKSQATDLDNKMHAVAIRPLKDTVDITATHAVGYPGVPDSPTIDYSLNITLVDNKGRITMSVEGMHDGFPGLEIYGVREGSTKEQLVNSYDPRDTGAGPGELIGDPDTKLRRQTKELERDRKPQ
jgi:RHS repeat-associated protein